ncbi:MAG: hypothetical protein KBF73_10850 [Flavobacteriales bacterium]|nr:hypothetical protein [Flavobacteriales bacterium]
MKSARFFVLAMFAISSFTFNSCNSDDDDEGDCLGTLQSSWKFNGVYEKSHVGLYSRTGSLMNLTFTACVEGSNDKVLSIAYFNYPPEVGVSQPLLQGPSIAGYTAMGLYNADVEGDFATDSIHTGTFTVTSIDTVAHLLSAEFQFTAVNLSNPSQTAVITEGVVNNIHYEN